MPYSSSSDDESSNDTSSSSSSSSSSQSSSNDESSVDEPRVYHQQGPVNVLYRHIPFYQDIFNDKNVSCPKDCSLYAPERNVTFFPKEPRRLTYRNIVEDFKNPIQLKKHAKQMYEDLSTARNKVLYRENPTTLGKNITDSSDEMVCDSSNDFMEKAFTQGYMAQFSNESIEECIHHKESTAIARTHVANVERNRIEDNPVYYGNCLQIIRCPCTRCNTKQDVFSEDDETETEERQCPHHCLLHPQGQNVAVSLLEQDEHHQDGVKMISQTNAESHDYRCDVGGTVLQLSCFHPNHDEVISIVRTPQHASILSCKWNEGDNCDLQEGAHCQMKLEEMDRFDPGQYIQNDKYAILQLIDLAVRNDQSTLPPPFMPPHVFATLSMVDSNSPLYWDGPKDIHHVITNHRESSEISVEHHHISNVDSISLIEFSDMHPKVLWSAARQNSKPVTCQTRGYRTRTSLGYGHSLYSIDLRSDCGSFLWSPSYDEFVLNDVHSVTGIYPDNESMVPHQVYVSTSVGKGAVYLIDARMPGKSLCSWQLPSMCIDSIGRSPGGVYGCGNLFAKPVGSMEPIILSATKEPGSLGASLYRKPKRYGNFGTRTIELVSQNGIESIGHAALSSYYPIPDDSKGLFQTGLAAFSYESKSSDNDIVEPQSGICIVSSLSSGDIILQSLSTKENLDETKYHDLISQNICQGIHVPHDLYNLIERSSLPETSATDVGGTAIDIETKQPAYKLTDPSSDSWQTSNTYTVADCIPSARLKRIKKTEKNNQVCALPSEDILNTVDRLKASCFKKE